jgi:hypothetical protein
MFKRASKGDSVRRSKSRSKERMDEKPAGELEVDPANFGKKASPVRDRMEQELRGKLRGERTKPGL